MTDPTLRALDDGGRSLRDDQWVAMPATTRLLLATDGTVTDLLAALHLEPIQVQVLETSSVDPSDGGAVLDPWPQEPTLRRRVALVGARTGRAHTFAESLLLIERLPDTLVNALSDCETGIGGAIRTAAMETLRRPRSCCIRPLPAWSGQGGDLDVVSRVYDVVTGGRHVMSIREWFLDAL